LNTDGRQNVNHAECQMLYWHVKKYFEAYFRNKPG